jgi:hypothetical protein
LDFGIDHFIENGAILEALRAGQGVEGSLEDRTARVTLTLDLNYWLSRRVVIFSKRLFIIVELLIIFLVDSIKLCLLRFVISNINVLEKCITLFFIGLLKESFNLSLHLFLLLGISCLLDDSMSHLDNLKIQTVTPLSHKGS